LLGDAAFELAYRVEIVVDHALVARSELALQVCRARRDHVENAAGLVDDLVPLDRVIALAEEAIERLAWVVLHRQRLRRRAERDGAAIRASELRVASAAAAFTGELDRRQRGVLADEFGRDLVRADTRIGLLAHRRVHAAEPRAGDDRVRARAFAGL